MPLPTPVSLPKPMPMSVPMPVYSCHMSFRKERPLHRCVGPSTQASGPPESYYESPHRDLALFVRGQRRAARRRASGSRHPVFVARVIFVKLQGCYRCISPSRPPHPGVLRGAVWVMARAAGALSDTRGCQLQRGDGVPPVQRVCAFVRVRRSV